MYEISSSSTYLKGSLSQNSPMIFSRSSPGSISSIPPSRYALMASSSSVYSISASSSAYVTEKSCVNHNPPNKSLIDSKRNNAEVMLLYSDPVAIELGTFSQLHFVQQTHVIMHYEHFKQQTDSLLANIL